MRAKRSEGYDYDYDYYTAKYAAANGALLWERRYNGPANSQDYPEGSRCLAVAPNGWVAIAGSSADDFSYDYATVVYRDNLSIGRVPAGIHLCFPALPGLSYRIQRSPAVTGPWSTIATLNAPPGGLIEYIDTTPPPGQAFYRTVQP